MPADRLAGSWEPCDGSCRRRGPHRRHQAFGRQAGAVKLAVSVCAGFSNGWCEALHTAPAIGANMAARGWLRTVALPSHSYA